MRISSPTAQPQFRLSFLSVFLICCFFLALPQAWANNSQHEGIQRSPAISSFGPRADWPDYYPKSFIKKFRSGELKNERLKTRLFKILSSVHIKTDERDEISSYCPPNEQCQEHQRDISYYQAREYLFGHLHLQENNWNYTIEDVYCQKDFDESHGVGPDQVPNHRYINCEHTWPQSRFSSRFDYNIQKVDLHHLYPSDSRSNSSRSNNIFAELDGEPVNETCTASERGEYRGTYAFEPPPEHRGNVARALFYFSVRYKKEISSQEEKFLKKWHREDPVDSFEKWRNNQIADFQGTRNPFIDQPSLVEEINNF